VAQRAGCAEVLRFLNIWRYSVVGPVLSTVLFVIVFGSALGRHVDAVDGVAYGRFIVPGLFAQAIVNVGFFNGTTSLFKARRDQYIHDLFASPLRWWEINAALVSGGIARGVIVGAGVWWWLSRSPTAAASPVRSSCYSARSVFSWSPRRWA
jgi:ABC-2 type transport system permease protein